jgi:hypothetical protein
VRSRNRRITTELTPLIDTVTILLFGVMINSVVRRELDTKQAVETAVQAVAESGEVRRALDVAARDRDRALTESARLIERIDELEGRLGRSEAQRRAADRRHLQEKLNLADAIAGLLQMDDPQRLLFRTQLQKLSGAQAQQLRQAVDQLRERQDPVQVYKAVRRIEEMQKVFTFIDLHIDDKDFLHVVGNGQPLERFPIRESSAGDIEQAVRRVLEAMNFNQMVLVLFSYEGAARDLTVERAESAANNLLSQYRASAGGQGRQFRYGRVGLVTAPPNPEKH